MSTSNSTFTVEKLQRGPTLNLIFSVTTLENQHSEVLTEPIDVLNKAQVMLKCCSSDPKSLSIISVKLKKKAKDSKVTIPLPLEISILNVDKLIFCVDEWVELPIIQDLMYSKKTAGSISRYQIYLFTVNIKITVLEITLTPSLNKELYEDTDFTDFQLHTTDGTVAVHKAILPIHSDMFKTMLSGEWKETTEGRINIDGVTVQTLQHLKDYMYLGTLPDEGLEQLLLIATRYLIDKLKAECIAKIVKKN